jgi:hypothetical protein
MESQSPDKAIAGESPEERENAMESRSPGNATGNSSGKRRKKVTWKKVLGALVALVVVWQLVHVFSQSRGTTASSAGPEQTGRAQAAPTRVPSLKPTPSPTITLNGHGVASGSGPLIVVNPGLVAPGGQVAINGSGFDPGATVKVWLRTSRSGTGTEVALGKVAKGGILATEFTMPGNLSGGAATVVAEEGNGSKAATAQVVSSVGSGSVTVVGKDAGKPGSAVTISATGFGPNEKVGVYWGRASGTPATTLTADGSGSIGRAQVPVGVAPVGQTSIVLVGAKTHAMAVASYQMLGLYPTTTPHPYAVLGGKPLSYSGSGFAPGEQVLIYLNASGGTPALASTADSGGSFHVSFVVPYGLKGSQTLTTVGEESRASVSGAFDVLPYTPSAQASTYSALPGTTVSFYTHGFAANEKVLVYTGAGPGGGSGSGSGGGGGGQAVSSFQVNGQGSALAAGQYVIPPGAGKAVYFTLVGQQSGGVATAKVSVGSAP